MELKIKISDEVYEAVKNREDLSFDELFGIFVAIANGTPTTVSKNKIGNILILNREEAKVFDSLSEEQRRVVGILLDNAAKQAEEKEKSDDLVSEKDIDDHKEVCKLMADYLGRRLDKHEIQAISIYKAIEHSKNTLTGLSGTEKMLMKMFIRSLDEKK